MKCKKCGANIPNGEIACPSCHIAVATMSQIKTEEDQARIEKDITEEQKVEVPTEEKVDVPVEPVDIRFEADVLKDVKAPIETSDFSKEVKEENTTNTSSMQPIQKIDESVDAEDVKKALKQYGDNTPKDIHFFLPIIIGIIVVLVIAIGIIYGVKTLL